MADMHFKDLKRLNLMFHCPKVSKFLSKLTGANPRKTYFLED